MKNKVVPQQVMDCRRWHILDSDRVGAPMPEGSGQQTTLLANSYENNLENE